jgi:hypothetical protein
MRFAESTSRIGRTILRYCEMSRLPIPATFDIEPQAEMP